MEKLFTTTQETNSSEFEDKLWEKTAEMGTFFVSNDPTHWIKDILTHFYEKFPFLQEAPVSISWKKQDKDRGIAVGSLEVLGGAVPIIIQGYEVAPLDVILVGDLALPMTEKMLRALFENIEAFEGLGSSSKKATSKIFKDGVIDVPLGQTGPYGSNSSGYTSRSSEKLASVIDNVYTVEKDDVISLLEACKQDSISFNKLAEQGNDLLLKKFAQKAYNEPITSKSDLERSLSIDRSYKYKDDNGNWFIKQANSNYTKEWTIRLTPQEAAEFDNYETNTITGSKKVSPLQKEASYYTQPLEQGETAKFILQDKETPLLTIDKVEENETKAKLASFKSFDGGNYLLSGDSSWNVTSHLVKEAAASSEPFDSLKETLTTKELPTKGDYGSFVWEGYITPPAEVVKVAKDRSNSYDKAQIQTFDGISAFNYKCTKFTKSDGFTKTAEDEYLIPDHAKWVKLGDYNQNLTLDKYKPGELKISALNSEEFDSPLTVYLSKEASTIKELDSGEWLVPSEASFKLPNTLEKTASAKPELTSLDAVYKDTTGLYNLIGPNFEKYAAETGKEITSLSKPEAIWNSIHIGAVPEDVNAINKLGSRSYHELEGKLTVPMKLDEAFEKVASEREESMGDRLIKSTPSDLVKVAAYFRRKGSVDAILSLSLLRKGNVRQYLASIPAYETVVSELARLLIASRLGLEGTDPDTIKDAMSSLTDVLFMLKHLSSTVEGIK